MTVDVDIWVLSLYSTYLMVTGGLMVNNTPLNSPVKSNSFVILGQPDASEDCICEFMVLSR